MPRVVASSRIHPPWASTMPAAQVEPEAAARHLRDSARAGPGRSARRRGRDPRRRSRRPSSAIVTTTVARSSRRARISMGRPARVLLRVLDEVRDHLPDPAWRRRRPAAAAGRSRRDRAPRCPRRARRRRRAGGRRGPPACGAGQRVALDLAHVDDVVDEGARAARAAPAIRSRWRRAVGRPGRGGGGSGCSRR